MLCFYFYCFLRQVSAVLNCRKFLRSPFVIILLIAICRSVSAVFNCRKFSRNSRKISRKVSRIFSREISRIFSRRIPRNFALVKRQGLYLVKWSALYLVKWHGLYLVKAFCPYFSFLSAESPVYQIAPPADPKNTTAATNCRMSVPPCSHHVRTTITTITATSASIATANAILIIAFISIISFCCLDSGRAVTLPFPLLTPLNRSDFHPSRQGLFCATQEESNLNDVWSFPVSLVRLLTAAPAGAVLPVITSQRLPA